jgi:type IV fimbrial biogenesis protein FimT
MALRRSAGFTLIELLVTIAIAAILLALALPTFTESIRANRVSTATNLMLATLNFARAEAVRSKSSARICPNNNGTSCGSNWSAGMLVWTDENGDAALTANEIKRVVDPQDSIDFTPPTGVNQISFDERGRTLDRAIYSFALQAHECKAGLYNRRSFAINRIGRVAVTKETCQ